MSLYKLIYYIHEVWNEPKIENNKISQLVIDSNLSYLVILLKMNYN
jgi:hypothetical protein